MSNPSKEHTSIRVHAPPGGHSNNIFGTSEFEQSAANKKKHMESDIFGSKADSANAAPAKQTRNAGNNIFGTDAEDSTPKGNTIAGQFKQTQMKSNIFGTDEPASSRAVNNKNQSNIFGIGDDDNKRQTGPRHGLRGGYNPINGESYNNNTKPEENKKQSDSTVETPAVENTNAQSTPTENTNTESAPANTNTENDKAPAANGNSQKEENAQKPVHTSVRVFHPPGGRSNGPLW